MMTERSEDRRLPARGKWRRFRAGLITVAVWVSVPALFGLTIYSIWMDRAASAAVSGAFTLAFVILHQLPIVESFKIFTLEAKFSKRVDEAERLLESIRSTAEVHSRMLYWQVGKGDRMATMPWALKNRMVQEFDELLGKLGLRQEAIAVLKTPFMHTIKLDLFRIFEYTTRNRVNFEKKRLDNRIAKYPKPIRADDQVYRELVAESKSAELPFNTRYDVMEDGRLDDMSAITAQLLNGTPLDGEEKERLEVVRGEVIRLTTACEEAGNITAEAEAYLMKYGTDRDLRAKELFEE